VPEPRPPWLLALRAADRQGQQHLQVAVVEIGDGAGELFAVGHLRIVSTVGWLGRLCLALGGVALAVFGGLTAAGADGESLGVELGAHAALVADAALGRVLGRRGHLLLRAGPEALADGLLGALGVLHGLLGVGARALLVAAVGVGRGHDDDFVAGAV